MTNELNEALKRPSESKIPTVGFYRLSLKTLKKMAAHGESVEYSDAYVAEFTVVESRKIDVTVEPLPVGKELFVAFVCSRRRFPEATLENDGPDIYYARNHNDVSVSQLRKLLDSLTSPASYADVMDKALEGEFNGRIVRYAVYPMTTRQGRKTQIGYFAPDVAPQLQPRRRP